MTTIYTNIRRLVGCQEGSTPLRGQQLSQLPVVENAFLAIKDDRIDGYGNMSELSARYPADKTAGLRQISMDDATVLPAWCDSHTHLVYAAPREQEFVQKIQGKSYQEIAASGGGILQSARALNDTPEETLFDAAWERLKALIALGTGAIEIKSGYGLTVEGELKMLRVIRRLREKAPIPVRATFLGAHAYPEQFKTNHEGYISSILHEMLPAIDREKLADYIDVFCENGFFSREEAEKICMAGRDYGLQPKVHANQLNLSGGVQAGVAAGAVSVDHLEMMDEEAILCLAASPTIGTLLPGAAFFLRMPFPPARRLIREGCAVALASDYNPGSSPSGNMNLVVSLACIQMKMLPEEAINAATLNGAAAMGLQSEYGSIATGKKANLVFMKNIPSLAYIPYSFGTNLIHRVMINGEWWD